MRRRGRSNNHNSSAVGAKSEALSPPHKWWVYSKPNSSPIGTAALLIKSDFQCILMHMELLLHIVPKILVALAFVGAIGCLLVIPITAIQILQVAFQKDNLQELTGK